MKITRNNYESFFLDFLEGNLEEDLVDQFLDFLEQNPDLKQELQQIDILQLPEEEIVFSEKQQLYKSTSGDIYVIENKIIAYLEGDLESEERKSFEAYLANHPKQHNIYNLFTKTRLLADAGIKFPDKQTLYRKSGTVILMNWVARIAAVFVLIWGINSLIQNGNQPKLQKSIQNLAVLNPKAEPPIKKIEPEQKNMESEVQEKIKPAKEFRSAKPKSIREQTKGRIDEKRSVNSISTNREITALTEITPILAQLAYKPAETQLAISHPVNILKINDPSNIVTFDAFLVSRAKKVGNEGLLSAQRIVRAGLGLASELSGERIGYSVKEGKITSLDFESKLLAFSIPLKK